MAQIADPRSQSLVEALASLRDPAAEIRMPAALGADLLAEALLQHRYGPTLPDAAPAGQTPAGQTPANMTPGRAQTPGGAPTYAPQGQPGPLQVAPVPQATPVPSPSPSPSPGAPAPSAPGGTASAAPAATSPAAGAAVAQHGTPPTLADALLEALRQATPNLNRHPGNGGAVIRDHQEQAAAPGRSRPVACPRAGLRPDPGALRAPAGMTTEIGSPQPQNQGSR